jgi:hypothetical protein
MFIFNDVIQHLDLVEVPLKGRAYKLSNMQDNCLLEKLDRVFTSSSWTLAFPNMMAYALAHVVSDHVPYVIQMESTVPSLMSSNFKIIGFPSLVSCPQWNIFGTCQCIETTLHF